MHGQATNDFGGSGVVEFGGTGVGPPAPGDVLPNVAFALPDGRVRDFGTAFVTADGVLLQASPWFGGGSKETAASCVGSITDNSWNESAGSV